MSEDPADNDVLRDLQDECSRQEKLSECPWSLTILGTRDDAEKCRALIPDLAIVGLDDPRLRVELPSGPDSCVLVLGEAPTRAAGNLRAAGVAQVFGKHLPLGHNFLSQFLEQTAQATRVFEAAAMREVFTSWVSGAKLIDVQPEGHPDLRAKPRLQGCSFEDLLDLPVPSTLIRAVLAEKAVVVLGGVSRSWKSFLVLDWHLHLLYGIPWRDQRVHAGSSIYFCGEGQANAGKRIKAWLGYHEKRIRGVDRGGRQFFVVGEVPTLTTSAGIADLRAYLTDFVAEHGPVAMLTIDTLSVGLTGEGDDENSNSMMASIAAAMGAIRTEFNCTIILVHHLRKDAESGSVSMNSLRGGIALSCNVDQVFLTTRNKEGQTLKLSKNKDGEDDREIARSQFEVVIVGEDEEKLPITSGVLVAPDEAELNAQIAALVRHYWEAFGRAEFTQSQAETERPAGVSRDKARSLLTVAVERSALVCRSDGNASRYCVPTAEDLR